MIWDSGNLRQTPRWKSYIRPIFFLNEDKKMKSKIRSALRSRYEPSALFAFCWSATAQQATDMAKQLSKASGVSTGLSQEGKLNQKFAAFVCSISLKICCFFEFFCQIIMNTQKRSSSGIRCFSPSNLGRVPKKVLTSESLHFSRFFLHLGGQL